MVIFITRKINTIIVKLRYIAGRAEGYNSTLKLSAIFKLPTWKIYIHDTCNHFHTSILFHLHLLLHTPLPVARRGKVKEIESKKNESSFFFWKMTTTTLWWRREQIRGAWNFDETNRRIQRFFFVNFILMEPCVYLNHT